MPETKARPVIYIFTRPAPMGGRMGHALAEDGTALASHWSSNESFAKHDMGLRSDWKHDLYAEHYPDGYELEWVESKEEHEGLQEALRKNRQEASQ